MKTKDSSKNEFEDRMAAKMDAYKLRPDQEEARARKVELEGQRLKEIGVDSCTGILPDNAGISDGLINPFALTETILETQMNWEDPRSMDILEEVLGSSYEQLISSEDSLLLTGRDPKMRVEEVETTTNKGSATDPFEAYRMSMNDLDRPLDPKRSSDRMKTIKSEDLGNLFKVKERKDAIYSNSKLSSTLAKIILPISTRNAPSNVSLREIGFQANGSHNNFDNIIQGGVGNCYLIAGLCALSWVHPGLLNMDVDFHDSNDEWTLYKPLITVNADGSPVNSTYGKSTNEIYQYGYYKTPVFARSRYWYNGEYWPALFENAYANSKNPNMNLYDAILYTAGGWAERAAQELTGNTWFYSTRYWLRNPGGSYNMLTNYNTFRDFILSHCSGWKAAYPMTLSAHPAHRPGIAYPHAYTVLGYTYHSGNYYLIIRNPHGAGEPSGAGVLSKSDYVFHFGKTQWFKLGKNDGIFALEFGEVIKNFRYLGYVY